MSIIYKTSDIALGSYLKLKGFKPEIKKINPSKAVFIFTAEGIKEEADSFYNGDGDFLSYASSMRSLKSQVMNMLKGDEDAT